MNIEVIDILDTASSFLMKRNYDELVSNINIVEEIQTYTLNLSRSPSTDYSIDFPIVDTSKEGFSKNFRVETLIQDILNEKKPKKIVAVQQDDSTEIKAIECVIDDEWFNKLAPADNSVVVMVPKSMNYLMKKKFTRKSTKKWSKEDRAKFYTGLELFGLDYSTISGTVLKNRSVKEISAFLKKEDAFNIGAVDLALKRNRENKPLMQFSIDDFCKIPSLEQVMEETCTLMIDEV